MKQFRNEFGEIVEALDEFDLYGAVERDQLIELVETAEESALAELAAFGCIEQRPQFDWSRKATPEERGWTRAVLDIIATYGAEEVEPLFGLM